MGRFIFPGIVSLMMVVVGCHTAPKPAETARAVPAPAAAVQPALAPAAKPAEPVVGAKVSAPAASPAPVAVERSAEISKPAPALPVGEYAVLIDSVPSGGTVVVNGIPVGKAPQRVILPGTSRGFFREEVSLKVRFVAIDAGTTSKTVEELLTPLDRIPSTVRFTPAGANRIMQ